MLGLCFFVQAFSCAWGKGLLIVMVSQCCRAQAPGWAGLSSCGAWAGHVAPSQTRGQTCVLCAVSQILIHCTTREVLQLGLNLQSWGQKTPFGACDFLFFIGCPLRLVGFYFQSPNCPLEVRACSLNHWSNRKFPCDFFFLTEMRWTAHLEDHLLLNASLFNAQWGQINHDIGGWSRERFIAGVSKGNGWLML